MNKRWPHIILIYNTLAGKKTEQTCELILWKWSCQRLNRTDQQATNCVSNHRNCTDRTFSSTAFLALTFHDQKRREKKEEINLLGVTVPNYRLPKTVNTCWQIVSSKARVCKLQPSSQMWPLPLSVNTLLLEYHHTPSFTYCL